MNRVRTSLDPRRIRRLIWLVLTIFVLIIQTLQGVMGTTHYSVTKQNHASVGSPPIILQSGNAGTSTIYANSTSARLNVVASAPTPTYYPGDYTLTIDNWWNSDYSYREKIKIHNNIAATLGGRYSVLVTFNTASLVSSGKMLSSGNDLRILYWNTSSSSWLELDRDVENMNMVSTKVLFKTQASINAYADDSNYFIYYGNPSAGNAPANKENVYVFYDDFESGNLGKWAIQSGTWTVTTDAKLSGSYSLKQPAISGVHWIKPSASLNEKDVLLESYWMSTAGTLDFAQTVRVQPGVNKNWYETNVEGAPGWDIAKYVNDAWTEITPNGGSFSANVWYKVTFIVKGETSAKVLIDDVQVVPSNGWATIGTDFTTPGTIALRTGITDTAVWVDNVKLRRYVDPEPTTSLETEEWWDTNYGYRQRIVISNNAASVLQSGYSVLLTLDTSSLVSSGKMLSNGYDLRIVYGLSQLDRYISNMNTDSTQVWFKTQAEIGVSGSDKNYYVYYGHSSAGNPPANKNNVYIFWDDFDDGNISDWTTMVGTWSAASDQYVSGSYSIKATTGLDSWIKPLATISETDLELEVYTRVQGGAEDWGICARVQSGTAKNWYMAEPETDDWVIGRFVSDSWSPTARGTPEPSAGVWYRVDFRIMGTQAQIWVDGKQRVPASGWTDLGTYFSSGSIALTTWDIGTGAWFDNVRLRKFAEPEPTLHLQDEELRFYVSGTLPTSVQNVDSDYFVIRSAGTSASKYFPSNYNLIGNTRSLSGFLSDSRVNDLEYMTLRSYVNQTSSTSVSSAFIGYRSSTQAGVNYLKDRLWNGTAWSSESEVEMWAGSPIRWVRTAFSTKSERVLERILVTLGDDGYYDVFVWDGMGTSWIVANDIADTSANAYRCFDIAYEKTAGRALFVYSTGSTTNEIGYRIWDGGSWSSQQLLNLPYTSGVVRWIALATNPKSNSNEIAMIYIDSNTDVFGYVWTGSAWNTMGQTAVWDATAAVSGEECIAVEYEQSSGKAMFVWGDTLATDNYYRIWNGTTLGVATLLDIPNQGAITNWVTLKGDPTSNGLVYLIIDGAFNLNTAYWNGTSWAVHAEHDSAIDTHARRAADFDWELSGGKGLLVWGTTAGQITYRTFTAPNTWGGTTNVTMQSGGTPYTHPWVQLRRNTRSISGDTQILGAVLESTASDLGAIKWDGTTFTVVSASTFTTNTGTTTYECFDVKFSNFGDPTQLVMEAEFTGTSNTEGWTQLIWGVDSGWTQGNVTITLQLYNYTLGDYPTSGNGCISYTSNPISNTDETKSQTITTSPTHFRNDSGGWKIKVKGVKSTSAHFDFKADWIEFKSTYYNDYTVSTEFLFSGMTTNTPTELNFTVVSDYDIASVNVTVQVWNYTASFYATSGEGYLTYTSSGSNETKLLSINANPQFYASSGNAKIKITGVKTITSQYQQRVNQVKLAYSYNASSTYNHVLRLTENHGTNWKVRLRAYDQSNIGRLSNCSLYIYNGSNSTQIVILNGAYNQQTGPWYDLAASDIEYIWMHIEASSAGTSYVYVYLEILVPNITTYAQYIVTFVIT